MPGPIFLEGEKVSLRPIGKGDVEFLQRYMNDPRVWRPALDVDPTNDEQCSGFFEEVICDSEGVHCLACEEESEEEKSLGVLSLTGTEHGPDETARSRAAELAYWFAPDYHGQGYGSDAAGRMVQYAFEDRNLRRVSARCGSFNDASIALLESLGFEREGRLREAAWYQGDYRDMLWYGLLREEWRTES